MDTEASSRPVALQLLSPGVYAATGDQSAGIASAGPGIRCPVYFSMDYAAPVWQQGGITVGDDSGAVQIGASGKYYNFWRKKSKHQARLHPGKSPNNSKNNYHAEDLPVSFNTGFIACPLGATKP